jgi:hypothetical protein
MKCSSPLTVVAALLGAVCVSSAAAHPGGLNREGCHNNRKTGGYHCHGGGARTRASPAASLQAQPADHEGSGSWSYRNCAAARAAGAAPVRLGEPGYGPHLDRDGDGIGCEPYRGR